MDAFIVENNLRLVFQNIFTGPNLRNLTSVVWEVVIEKVLCRTAK